MIYNFYRIILPGIFLFILFLLPSPSYGDGGYFTPHIYHYRISKELMELLNGKIDSKKLESIKNHLFYQSDYSFDTEEGLTAKVGILNSEEIRIILDYADIYSTYTINSEVMYELKNQIDSKKLEKLNLLKRDFYKADLVINLKKLNFTDKEIEHIISYTIKRYERGVDAGHYFAENYLFGSPYGCPIGLDIEKNSIEVFYDTYISPTQEGIISFNKGKETLIIRVPALELPSFAWVVPVPSYPEVKKGDQILFSLLLDTVREDLFSNGKFWESPCYSPGQGLILDGGGSSGPAEPEPDTVKVYEKKTVGNFDIAIISAKKTDDLINWLNKNEFYFPQKAAEPVEFYIKKQWYFVAMKIKNPGLLKDLHPVEFIFDTKEPVYPMKITSIQEGDSRVNLYIFSDGEKGCPWMYRIWDGDYHKLSSVVTHIENFPPHLTVITGRIRNSDIKNDITLKPMFSYVLSKARLLYTVYWIIPVLTVIIICSIVLYRQKKKNMNLRDKVPMIFTMILIMICFYIITPGFLKARAQGHYAACESNLKNLATALEMYATDNTGSYPASLDMLTNSTLPGGGFMKTIPLCPLVNRNIPTYVYGSASDPEDKFTIFCMCKHYIPGSLDPVVFPRCGTWHIANNYSPFLDPIEIEKIKEEKGFLKNNK